MEQNRLYQAYFDHGYGSRTYSKNVYEDRDQCWEEAKEEFRYYNGGEISIIEVHLKPKEQHGTS